MTAILCEYFSPKYFRWRLLTGIHYSHIGISVVVTVTACGFLLPYVGLRVLLPGRPRVIRKVLQPTAVHNLVVLDQTILV